MTTFLTVLLFFLNSLLFFFLGRWTCTYKRAQNDTIDEIIEKTKRIVKPKIKPGVIPFKTPEDFEDEANGDKELEKHWIKSGIDKLL